MTGKIVTCVKAHQSSLRICILLKLMLVSTSLPLWRLTSELLRSRWSNSQDLGLKCDFQNISLMKQVCESLDFPRRLSTSRFCPLQKDVRKVCMFGPKCTGPKAGKKFFKCLNLVLYDTLWFTVCLRSETRVTR